MARSTVLPRLLVVVLAIIATVTVMINSTCARPRALSGRSGR